MKKKKIRALEEGSQSPTISACMILKNEEVMLPECLDSIKKFTNEIIVVDTGSTDRTVEIAERYGAQIYHHPWENDFSKHRNQSISYANGEWIFIIDADERLVTWDPSLKRTLLDKNIDGIYVNVKNAYGYGEGEAWHNSIRLFRKNSRISYKYSVHNELVGYSRPVYSSTVLHHSGYALNPIREEAKFQRTKGLLEEAIKMNPEDPRNHHYMAVTWLGKRLYGQALQEAEIALRQAGSNREAPLFLWTRFVAAVSCINLGKVDEAEHWCRQAIALNSNHLDSYYLLSTIGYAKGQLQPFLEISDRYLSLTDKAKKSPGDFENMVMNTMEHEWRIHLHRGFAFEILGSTKKAEKEYAVSLKQCRDKMEYNHLISEFRRSHPKPVLKVSVATGKKPGISLCMIVKNEEILLPQCLESVKELVDEMVIVDTGSTDRTMEIAKNYGARIYEHPWEGNFSKHRNQSIAYAQKEWILILDADEFLERENAPFMREVLKEKKADGIYLKVRSAFDRGRGEAVHNSLRLFKNNGRIRYEGRVHNRLVGEQASLMYPLTIFHEGYNLPEDKSHQKFLRTTALLKKEIEEHPDHPRAYHYLAASYLSEDRLQEALDFSQKAIYLAEKLSLIDHLYLWSRFIAGISSLKLGNLDEAEKICLKGLAINPEHLDSHYLLVVIYFQRKEWEKVLVHGWEFQRIFSEIQSEPGKFGHLVHNTINHRWRAHAYLGLALEELNIEGDGARQLSLAQRFCEDQGEFHTLAAGYYLSKGDLGKAKTHFETAVNLSPEAPELLKIGMRIFQKQGDRQKAIALLERVRELEGPQEESSFQLGTLFLEENTLSEAWALFQKVIETNPDHAGALINLGLIARREKRDEEAIFFFRTALLKNPASVEGLSNLANALYHQGELVEAEEALNRLTKIAPALIDPLLLLSKIHVQLGYLDKTVEDCDVLLQLLDLDRSVVLESLEDLANLYIGIGERLNQKGQSELSPWAYDTAMLLTGNNLKILQKILVVYEQAGNYQGAWQYADKVTASTKAPAQ